mmetsp:Transcript_41138/g.76072  ORF Transcript_41138/g.76072 Transcript_41138/m.76072 type:complete len:581 (-) Transcript_41138:158-1900(-)
MKAFVSAETTKMSEDVSLRKSSENSTASHPSLYPKPSATAATASCSSSGGGCNADEQEQLRDHCSVKVDGDQKASLPQHLKIPCNDDDEKAKHDTEDEDDSCATDREDIGEDRGEEEDEEGQEPNEDHRPQRKKHNHRADSPRSFPSRLVKCLNGTSADPHAASIIAWLPNGDGFAISDTRVFEREILPIYFKGGKYSSFKRRLNRWGFRLLNPRGNHDRGVAFWNEWFRRDDPGMRRKMVSRNPGEIWGKRGASSAKRDEHDRLPLVGEKQEEKETEVRSSMASRLPQLAGKRRARPKSQPEPQLSMPPSFQRQSVPHLAPRTTARTELPQMPSSLTEAGRQATIGTSAQLHTPPETQAQGGHLPLHQNVQGHQLNNAAQECYETPQQNHQLVPNNQLLSLVSRGSTQMAPSSYVNPTTTVAPSRTQATFPPIASTNPVPQVSSANSAYQTNQALFNNSSLSFRNGIMNFPAPELVTQQLAPIIPPPPSQLCISVIPVATVVPVVSLPFLQVNPVQLVLPQVQAQELLQLQQMGARTTVQPVATSSMAAQAANDSAGLADNPSLAQVLPPTAAIHPSVQ